VIRWWIDEANALVAWVRKSRRICPGGSVVKVNVGSSLFVTDGWINVDGSPHVLFAGWPAGVLKLLYKVSDARNWCGEPDHYVRQLKKHVFVHHNLEYGMPFSNESVDFVYSSHVLEHFHREAAERVLRDIHRILKIGGRFRVCVPDLEYAYRLYCQGRKEQALSYFFEPRSGEFNTHRYMYDFEMLAALLGKVGFRSIEKCAHQQGLVPDLQRLDNRPEETLYVECVRSCQSIA
jgi:SAM-dependent methyltransferase